METVYRAIFRDWLSRSNTNGGQFWCRGDFVVLVDKIPDDAPQDWEPQPVGSWGAYRLHEFYPRHHGPHAFATARTAADAMCAAQNYFRGYSQGWEKLTK